jgi:NADPH-dependent curcumin reductase CurA
VPTISREVHLRNRPTGMPTPDDFTIVENELPDPGPGEVLVRNIAMSVDPYMRGRMNDVESYSPPWQLNQVMEGSVVGEVIASGTAQVPVGTLVSHQQSWREFALLPERQARRIEPLGNGLPLSVYLGALGGPGLTAWVGLLEIAKFEPGETVFVSGAAGAVGSLVGQFAQLKGAARVIGSAGSPQKVAWLKELGFDAAFDYHDGPVSELLPKAAPDGIDVYFDNVGGEHLEASLTALKPFGRAALCGAISTYNFTQPAPGPNNLSQAVGKQLILQGFIVSSYGHLWKQMIPQVKQWLESGEVQARETVVEGLDQAADALLGLFSGANTGKMVVRLAPDPE